AHSGPINQVEDVNRQPNVAGAGINTAQRILDCGDAGHILLSKRLADDLAEYSHWRPYLTPLGECTVKHGVRLRLVNFVHGQAGNPKIPEKLRDAACRPTDSVKRRRLLVGAAIFGLVALLAVGTFLVLVRKQPNLPPKSVAVLPFESLSDLKDDAYFADGMQDEILRDLVKVADLKVISRTSASKYPSGVNRNLKQIARDLGVRYVLEGSV